LHLRSSDDVESATLFLRLNVTDQKLDLTADARKATQGVVSITHSPSVPSASSFPDTIGTAQVFGLYDSMEIAIGRLESLKAVLQEFDSVCPDIFPYYINYRLLRHRFAHS
jgi:hypothetical protein